MTELSALPALPRLAKYELLEEIGHGGMATVYRARDKRLGREVAIKIIHKHLRENAEVGKRFIAEARAAAKLRHPCIVEVHDVSGEEDGERYLVVELCRGTTLRKILEQHRDMPAEIGAAITLVLCDALEHAHESGIIHRDVKPENVLVELPSDRKSLPQPRSSSPGDALDAEPESSRRPISKRRVETNDERLAQRRAATTSDLGVIIKLTDFGIAKMLDSQGVTSTGQVLGSPAHMAPEQIEAGEVDGRTDVFALGVLMYECLVGHLPFEGKNPAQVLRRVLEGSYPTAARERNTVGGRWSRIVDGALAGRLEDRTASPAKLAERIREELEALGMPDGRAEIEAYFANPEEYARSLAGRLVPRLLSRGEAARKAGDVVGAADDFNRALALAPDDQTIFKRVRSLQSSAARRRIAQRAALVVGAVSVLGGIAFGIARWRKAGPVVIEADGSDTRGALSSSPTPNPNPTTIPAPVDSSLSHVNEPVDSVDPQPSARVKVSAAPVTSGGPPPASRPTMRKVSIVINPQGAKLTLDGREESWFSRVFSLKTGAHSASARVEGSKCCEAFSGAIHVEPAPDEDPEQVQRISIRLKPLPATVTLSGAPANSHVVCTDIMLTVYAGGTGTVQLSDAAWNGKCQFVPPPPAESMRNSVLLRAGEHNVVAWPKK
ncbi:MAG TPA: serine/threonine-protein kinase [Polyangium sp.]|nr:serine/threonine-protein kinase [Polyangium sp.]